MVQTGKINKKTKERQIKIRSIHCDKIITEFNVSTNDYNPKDPQSFCEYHHGFLYVTHNKKGPMKVYDVKNIRISDDIIIN